MTAHEFDQRLCKQFNRGCTNDTMLLKLRLDEYTVPAVDLITCFRTGNENTGKTSYDMIGVLGHDCALSG